MKRSTWIGWVVAVALLGVAMSAQAKDKTPPPDLTGQWKLDRQHSDLPQRPEGMRPGGGMLGGMGGPPGEPGEMGGERMGGGRRAGGMRMEGGEEGRPEARGPRPVRLPDLIHVTETPTIVSIEDSSGAVLEEIATVSAEADTFAQAPGAQHVPGQWKGDQLVVERPGPRGGKVTETFSLEDQGKTLVIRTQMEPRGDRPAREFKRVYRKVTAKTAG